MTSTKLLSAALFASTLASSWADDLPVVRTKIRSLEVFKNGVGFVNRNGQGTLSGGWAKLDTLPASTLGSFWLGSADRNAKVTELVTYKDRETSVITPKNIQQLMAINMGKRVAVTFSGEGGVRRVEGLLLAIPGEINEESALQIPVDPSEERSLSRASEIVMLRTSANGKDLLLTLPKTSIMTLELLEEPILNSKKEKELDRAKIRVEGADGNFSVNMNYLQKGWAWSPFYRINIANEKTATLDLDAVLMNDTEDLQDAEVSFVVGYPHFLYIETPNPLGLRQNIGAFLQTLSSSGAERYQAFANSIVSQSINYSSHVNTPSADSYSANISLPGEGAQDFYFYKQSHVTLKKGERARYSVLQASAPYEHIYQWEIPDSINVDDRGYRQDMSNRKEQENLVWHVIRLENTSKQPWTTAPAFGVDGQLPVGQDMLGYAPPGQKSNLKLAVAPEIRAEQAQTETGRKQTSIENSSFDEVSVEGKLKVTNLKSQEVCVVIRKSLIGSVTEAAQGKITRTSHRLMAFNTNSDIEWEFHLQPGKVQELVYQYKILLRR